jgi:hypothetical protein
LSLAKSSHNSATGGPPPVPLTETVAGKVRSLFPADVHADAIRLLEKECGRNLPFHEEADSQGLERVRLAVVKLSRGNLAELRKQLDVAIVDWRDVLAMAEEPEAFKLSVVALIKLDADSRAALNARDKKQYDDWLRG